MLPLTCGLNANPDPDTNSDARQEDPPLAGVGPIWRCAVVWSPSFRCVLRADGDRSWRVGHDQIDEFLEFAHGRVRPATVRAYAHDLKTFFAVVGKEPAQVTARDVLDFVAVQRRPRAGAEKVVRISDGGAGLSASTIKRRLAAASSFYGYLVTRGDVTANPVPRGLPTRTSRHRASVAWCRWCEGSAGCRASWSRPKSKR